VGALGAAQPARFVLVALDAGVLGAVVVEAPAEGGAVERFAASTSVTEIST
jgi:hypothetical protein